YSNDALKLMLADKKRIVACEIKNGRYYDAGNKLDYIKAVIEFALEQDELHAPLEEFIRTLTK
ncbi:MAG: UTP--glucose-1-phosphate uridylyltransferase, partial [Candidatus Saccharimonadales bacterium]